MFKEVAEQYSVRLPSHITGDTRGAVNKTFFLGREYVLTIFQNRKPDEVIAISEIVRRDSSGLLPKIVGSNKGPISFVSGKPAILWHRINGRHYVGVDHSRKRPIPSIVHAEIARSYWALHSSLAKSQHIGKCLGEMSYVDVMRSAQETYKPNVLPQLLQKDFVADYLETTHLPLKYKALVHSDMERHNLLHGKSGNIAGIVDVDSILTGDLLFEYAHLMMNQVFTDPSYKASDADLYINALIDAKMIDNEDVSLLPSMVRLFAAEDILYYHQNDRSQKTNLSLLVKIYEQGLVRASDFFSARSQSGPYRPEVKRKTSNTYIAEKVTERLDCK